MYQFLIHTELVGKLGPLEWVFNTPSHHRVHHASNIAYLDRNHPRISLIVRAPGWSPDGSTLTADQTRAKWAACDGGLGR